MVKGTHSKENPSSRASSAHGETSTQRTVRLSQLPKVDGSPSRTSRASGSHARAQQADRVLHGAASPASKRSSGSSARAGSSRKGSRRGLVVAAVVVAVLLVIYLGGAWFFSTHFYPRSTLGDIDVSLQDAATVTSELDNRMSTYALDVTGDGFSWTVSAADAGLDLDHHAVAQAALDDNNPWTWPVQMLFSHDEGNENEGSLDEDGLRQAVEAQVATYNEGRTAPQDATIAYDDASGSFAVVAEKPGDQLSSDAVFNAVKSALLSLEPTLELGDSELAQPTRHSTDPELAQAVSDANDLLGVNITLTMGGTQVATVDSSVLSGWITLDENYKASVSNDAVTAWVDQLASQLDTVGTQRTYTRPDGKQITVAGGTYGWTSDEAALVDAVKKAVTDKQSGELAVPTKQTAAKYTALGQQDWGAYVDIDLVEQHARYYDASGNLLWESGVITANTNGGYETPTGVYFLNNKARNQTLIGLPDPATGEPLYRSQVSYWMPFVDNMIGLHDASWQASSSFSNPSAYLSVGSHGCVNLPTSQAAALYDIIQVGDCVIVHN